MGKHATEGFNLIAWVIWMVIYSMIGFALFVVAVGVGVWFHDRRQKRRRREHQQQQIRNHPEFKRGEHAKP